MITFADREKNPGKYSTKKIPLWFKEFAFKVYNKICTTKFSHDKSLKLWVADPPPQHNTTQHKIVGVLFLLIIHLHNSK